MKLADALECLITTQRQCNGCPFNPYPGESWPYGCVSGQRKMVEAVREVLKEVQEQEGGI